MVHDILEQELGWFLQEYINRTLCSPSAGKDVWQQIILIQVVAMASINFSYEGVWLPFKGSL